MTELALSLRLQAVKDGTVSGAISATKSEVDALSKAAVTANGAVADSVQRTTKALNDQSQAARASGNVITGVFRSNTAVVQQMGYQVSDLAVQIASGGGVLRPLIQQGSQVLQMFGPAGAVLGAVASVAGAVAIGMGGVAEETDKAAESQLKLADALHLANDRMKTSAQLARDNTGAQIAAARNAIVQQIAEERRRSATVLAANEMRPDEPALYDPTRREGAAQKPLAGPSSRGSQDLSEARARIDALQQALDQLGENRSFEQIWGDLEKLRASFAPAADDLQHYERRVALLEEAWSRGAISLNEYAELLNRTTDAYNDAARAADPFVKQMQEFAKSEVARIDAASNAEQSIFDMATALRAETDALKLSNKERETRAALLRAGDIAAKGGTAVTPEQERQIRGAIDAKYAAQYRGDNARATAAAEEMAARDAAEAAAALNRQQERQAQVLDELRGGQQAHAERLQVVDELYRRGAVTVDEWARANREADRAALESKRDWESGVSRALMRIEDDAENMARAGERAMMSLNSAGEDLFGDFLNEGSSAFKKLGDVAVQEIGRVIYQMTIAKAVGAATGAGVSWLGNLFGNPGHPGIGAGTAGNGAIIGPASAGLPFHTGRGPGEFSRPRSVPAWVYAGAPRFHSGIGPGEIPAIIRDDESVLTPGQMRALGAMMGRGAGMKVEIYDQRGAGAPPVETQSERGPGGIEVMKVFIRREVNQMLGDGSTDQTMRHAYGARRQPGIAR